MVASLVYSLIRVLVDVMVTSRSEEAELQAEVLALRRQVQVLERQIKRVRWSPADRMILAALRERLPRSAWAGLLVKPDGARLASSAVASEVGGLSSSTQARQTADPNRCAPAHHPDGP